MWRDHTFSQSNKATKRVQGKGVEPPPPHFLPSAKKIYQ